MKLLLLIVDENENTRFVNSYLDLDSINGFWIEPFLYENEIALVNLIINGQIFSVVKNENLIHYLDNKFKRNKIELK